MKLEIALLAMLAAAQAMAATPSEKCQDLAQYAQLVAELRDQGVRLKKINEITREKVSGIMADVYERAAGMVYRSDLKPKQVHEAMLSGCLESVADAKR